MEVKLQSVQKMNLSFSDIVFASGEITALIGDNGRGKTTLLNIIAGLDADFLGEVTYDNVRLSQTLREQITMTFQTPMLLNRSVYANLEYPLKIRKISERKAKIEFLLKKLNLEQISEKNATKLSGGESQRVALARALIIEPKLLLLDEPFSAIDESSISEMEKCILDYHSASGATIILVSHNRKQVDRLCSKVVSLGVDFNE